MAEKEKFNFRWKSWLGFSVALFLLYGVVNVFFALMVPYSLHTQGAGAMGGFIVSDFADSKILGLSLKNIVSTNPRLNDFLVAFMDTMCMMMMGLGILHVAVAWFALRKRQLWALWTLAFADLSFIPYWMAIASIYAKYAIPNSEVWGAFGGFFIIVIIGIIVATVVGWVDLRKAHL